MNRNPQAVDPLRCVAKVWFGTWDMVQCSRKRGHGPDGLYCKQHDPERIKERRAKQSERYKYVAPIPDEALVLNALWDYAQFASFGSTALMCEFVRTYGKAKP